jgi:thiamine-phosphate pyrophosphorylase
MVDYSLYLVTDRALSRGRSNREVVEAAVKGGVSCVQIREKECSTRDFVRQARELKKLLKPLNIPLIVNDRIDVALAVEADGIHLGQTDMAIADARRIVGDDMIIGISAESLDDATQAELQGADYIGISPVFATPTKDDTAPPLGIRGVEKISQNVSIPIVGIGGLNRTNAKEIILAGADGIAVVSAVVSAPSPEQAAHELSQLIIAATKERNGIL